MKPILKPVWINYWGFIPLTRRAYLITLGIGGVVLLLVVFGAAALGGLPPPDIMWSRQHHLPGSGLTLVMYNYTYWIILALLAAQAVDTWYTLRLFARKQAEQWARLGQGQRM
jgi:hypothetical protein